MTRRTTVLLAATAMGLGCRGGQAPPLFELLPPAATGVTFANRLPEDTSFNILNYLYYYNGGGVAVGDIDGDGLPDLYFTANLGPNRLYRNLGSYRFEDITDRAGVTDSLGWKSGVAMADVNGDGRIDLYVSGVSYLDMHGRNVLFVNNGDGTFTDRTSLYGLEHVGYSTQAVFFDYDGDGDLDMYLLNSSTHSERTAAAHAARTARNPRAGDVLYRNDGGHFVDVSERAGIHGSALGFGLGVVASDLNLDGCPDLYVANDFDEDDFVYLNNCDGTFTESVSRTMGHTSRFSMGVDAADFNNDGRPDLMVLDMMPEREDVLKTSANAEDFTVFNTRLEAGFHPQYARNTLQLNRGLGHFSEIGYLAGVYATDWSWAPLFADLDNDGFKDLFITNGIYRRPNDLDYIAYVGSPTVQASLAQGITRQNLTVLDHMPQRAIANYAYRNNGDLTFTDRARAWGLAQPGFSNGAAYADLNNSGSLDLVVNNLNAPAAIYRNRARAQGDAHYLTVQLRGTGGNTAGIGAKVMARTGGRVQFLEQMPTRGFQSAVDPRLHFGLGPATRVDSLTVVWPDRRFQVLTDVAVDRTETLSQDDARGRYVYRGGPAPDPWFADITESVGIDYRHRENTFYEYTREPLIPHQVSTEGPALAVGDVNGDGLDDLYAGGAKWQPGRLYLQQRDGGFHPTDEAVFAADSLAEDVDAAFVDADGDGRLDLYVASGGNEFWGRADALQGRLYLNDGQGHFHKSTGALPAIFENASCVVPGDFNGDGSTDLFVGSRVVARAYGTTPQSHLFQNDGHGRFRDVTSEIAPSLGDAGMVTSAAWIDSDHDGQLDLIVVGEWMPIRVFRQERGHFVDRTAAAGLTGTEGWWNTVTVADVNGDGRPDLVLGNLGRNSYLTASPDQPARAYVGNFFQNGIQDEILTFYKHGVSYPLAGRDELLRVMPQLQGRFPSYEAFGASRIEDILPRSERGRAKVLEARRFETAVAINRGDGTFDLRPLPVEAQFAPVYAILADDFDGDGNTDLLVAGNLYGVSPVLGRYDASFGLLLQGKGDGRFDPVDTEQSGLVIEGQARHLAVVRRSGGERVVAVARNNDRLQFLRPLRRASSNTTSNQGGKRQ